MPDRPRVVMVGAGHLASTRVLPSVIEADLEVVAICDLDPERAEAGRRRYGIPRAVSDVSEVLDPSTVDGVVVCVGPASHETIAIQAMRAGIPVYTEKPPAVSAAAAHRMAETSRETGVFCMTAFKKRFAPAYVRAKEIMGSEDFGETSLLTVHQGIGAGHPTDTDFFLHDFCVHALDLVRYLGGDVSTVHAARGRNLAYLAKFEFESGAIGTWTTSGGEGPDEHVRAVGGANRYLFVEDSVRLTAYRGRVVTDRHAASYSTASADSLVETGFLGEMRAFAEFLRSGTIPATTIHDAARTMDLFEAVRASCETDSIVKLPK